MKGSLIAGFMTFVIAIAPAFAVNEKYAYVDIAKVFDGYEKTKANDKVLQDAGKKKEEERDTVVREIRQLKDEVALLAEDAKAKKQESLDGKIRQLQDFDRDAKLDLGQKRNTVVREIFKDIDGTLQRYGERKGYDMVFNERALLFHSPKYDVTQDVLVELNKEYLKAKK